MTDERRSAYVISQCADAMVTALGMVAENKQREIRGESPAYGEEHFQQVITSRGIHHNAVVQYLFHQ